VSGFILQDGVKQGSGSLEPKAPPNGGGEAPAGPEFFTAREAAAVCHGAAYTGQCNGHFWAVPKVAPLKPENQAAHAKMGGLESFGCVGLGARAVEDFRPSGALDR